MKTVEYILLQRVRPVSSGLFPFRAVSFWHLIGMDPARAGIGARLKSVHCGFSCSGWYMPEEDTESIISNRLSNCIICFIKWMKNVAFFQPIDHCWLCWSMLFGGTSWPWPLPAPASILGIYTLPLHISRAQLHDICAICRKRLSRPGGWK